MTARPMHKQAIAQALKSENGVMIADFLQGSPALGQRIAKDKGFADGLIQLVQGHTKYQNAGDINDALLEIVGQTGFLPSEIEAFSQAGTSVGSDLVGQRRVYYDYLSKYAGSVKELTTKQAAGEVLESLGAEKTEETLKNAISALESSSDATFDAYNMTQRSEISNILRKIDNNRGEKTVGEAIDAFRVGEDTLATKIEALIEGSEKSLGVLAENANKALEAAITAGLGVKWSGEIAHDVDVGALRLLTEKGGEVVTFRPTGKFNGIERSAAEGADAHISSVTQTVVEEESAFSKNMAKASDWLATTFLKDANKAVAFENIHGTNLAIATAGAAIVVGVAYKALSSNKPESWQERSASRDALNNDPFHML